VHYRSEELALSLKPRMTGGTGSLKWKCITNCHLFSSLFEGSSGLAGMFIQTAPT